MAEQDGQALLGLLGPQASRASGADALPRARAVGPRPAVHGDASGRHALPNRLVREPGAPSRAKALPRAPGPGDGSEETHAATLRDVAFGERVVEREAPVRPRRPGASKRKPAGAERTAGRRDLLSGSPRRSYLKPSWRCAMAATMSLHRARRSRSVVTQGRSRCESRLAVSVGLGRPCPADSLPTPLRTKDLRPRWSRHAPLDASTRMCHRFRRPEPAAFLATWALHAAEASRSGKRVRRQEGQPQTSRVLEDRPGRKRHRGD